MCLEVKHYFPEGDITVYLEVKTYFEKYTSLCV